MKIFNLLAIIFLVLTAAGISAEEIYRIRVENTEKGLVQVSMDRGDSYYAVGRVLHPANGVKEGFMASEYIEGGSVVATSSHGIRLKISPKERFGSDFKEVRLFSLVPEEFYVKPTGFGGHVAGSSGIYTDIPSGTSIFLNQSPFAGSKIYLESNGQLLPIPENHTPRSGDVYVILVNYIPSGITSVDFENKADGTITVTKRDGSSEILGKVVRPVSGIGRYDGTTFDEPGQLNTAHGGVVTISSSKKFPSGTKEGEEPETRGGFMIQPYYHTIKQGETKPQVMVIGKKEASYDMEGTAPLYLDTINLWYYKDFPNSSFKVYVKIDGGVWENMPEITGKIDNGLTPEYLNKIFENRNISTGITDIRLQIPDFNKDLCMADLKKSADKLAQRTIKQGAVPVGDTLTIDIPKDLKNAEYYTVAIDGKMRFMGLEPFVLDTSKMPCGVHSITINARMSEKSRQASKYFLVRRNDTPVGSSEGIVIISPKH